MSSMPTLSQNYKDQTLLPAIQEDSQFPPSPALNSKITLIRTSITDLEVTSIVNAANTSLLGGGGVDGAIHAAAGPNLLRECETLNGCDTGFAKITSAYQLPSKYVIHAVGPVYGREKRKRDGLQAELLASCYKTSLDLAAEKGGSIAFSCLSTGIYGYPSDEAAEVACITVRSFLESEEGQNLDRVVFCCFLQKDELEYQRLLPMIFPPSEDGLLPTDIDNDNPENDKTNPEVVKSVVTSAAHADESIDESWVAVEKPHPTAVADETVSKESQTELNCPAHHTMEPLASIEEAHDEGEDEAPLPAPFEDKSTEAESHMTPLAKSKARSRSPYTDRFGLRQPPPPSKLYGGDNLHYLTGVCVIDAMMRNTAVPMLTSVQRREYLKEDQDLLPFHHEPETYIHSTRRTVSTAGCDTFQEAEAMQGVLMEQTYKDHVDNRAKLHCLEDIKTFTRRSCLLMKKSPSDRRSVEDRMEDLLKEYSFDKMRPRTRKVDGAQAAEPYVPFPGRNVDCQRSAGTLPRKELDEMTP
ncbi:MAG: hypothetical protein L6R42_009101 [Xanthoria sp. 1 TBL-2021]|nr:MAG: hypothetical protein L6R42_009101 [Xanthoria sp. 1 TBL-2021]